MTVGGIALQFPTQNPAYKPTHGFFYQAIMETWSQPCQFQAMPVPGNARTPVSETSFLGKGSVPVPIDVAQ